MDERPGECPRPFAVEGDLPMKKRRSQRMLLAVIVLLCVALAAIAGVVLFKQYEYGVSELYYESLRTGRMGG